MVMTFQCHNIEKSLPANRSDRFPIASSTASFSAWVGHGMFQGSGHATGEYPQQQSINFQTDHGVVFSSFPMFHWKMELLEVLCATHKTLAILNNHHLACMTRILSMRPFSFACVSDMLQNRCRLPHGPSA